MRSLIIIVLTLCTFAVHAQQDSTSRDGFVIGFGIGGGVLHLADTRNEITINNTQGGFSFPNLKIGFMINERLAFLVTTKGMIYDYDGKDRSMDALTPSIQFWIKNKWWINGGFGLAMDMPAFYDVNDFADEEWNFGCVLTAGTGYEVLKRNNFAMDLQANVMLGRTFLGDDNYRDGAGFLLGLGFNWY
mgnify:CR=1 FL=1